MAAPAGWTARIPITTNPASIEATMPDGGVGVFATNFEFLEGGDNDEGDIRAFVDAMLADYSDLVVTQSDGETTVPYDVRQFSQVGGSRELSIGLGAPSLSSAVGTDFYLHRGCTGGPFRDPAGVVPTADGILGTWPLEDAGETGTASDWTGVNDGTYHGTVQIAGAVGMGQDIENDDGQRHDNYVALPFDTEIDNLGAFSASIWTYRTSGINYQRAVWLRDVGANKHFQLFYHQDLDEIFCTLDVDTGRAVVEVSEAFAPAGEWVLLSVTWDGSTLRLYIDATERAADATKSGALDIPDVSGQAALGNVPGAAWASGWRGYLDEAQLFSRCLSADWIRTAYENQKNNDTFWTVGAEEAAGGGGPIIGSSIIGSSIIGSGIIIPLPDYIRRR